MDERLSENFYLSEFQVSEVAARRGIDMSIPVGSPVYYNIKRLVSEVLQPARDAVGLPFVITSGYRPQKLNRIIGGATTSQHTVGEAADIVVPGLSPYEVCRAIVDAGIPFDQLIHEFGRWTHVSTRRIGARPRGQTLTSMKRRTLGIRRTIYVPGIQEVTA